MKSQVIKIENQDFLVGLDWPSLEGQRQAAKQKRSILSDEKNKGVKFGLMVTGKSGYAALGLMSKDSKLTRAPSAAAMLAYAFQEAQGKKASGGASGDTTNTSTAEKEGWIYIEQLPGKTDADVERYWIVAIQQGIPLTGTDIICEIEELQEALSVLLDNAPFIVFSRDKTVRDFVAFRDVPVEAQDRSLNNLIKGVKTSKCQVQQITGIKLLYVIAGTAVLLLGGTGWMYNEHTKEQERLAQEAQQAADQQMQQKKAREARDKYEQTVKDAIQAALDKGVTSVKGKMKSPTPSETLRAFHDLIGNTALAPGGWEITGFNCRLQRQEASCVVSAQRTPVGTNRSLLNVIPDAEIKGERATFKITGNKVPNRGGGEWKDIPTTQSLMTGVISEFQMIERSNIKFRIGRSADVVEPIAMPEPPRGVFKNRRDIPKEVDPVKLGISSGSITVSGDLFNELPEIGQFLDYSNLAFKDIKVDKKGSWVVNMDYVVRSSPQPQIPVVNGPNGEITIDLPQNLRADTRSLEERGGTVEELETGKEEVGTLPAQNQQGNGRNQRANTNTRSRSNAAPAPQNQGLRENPPQVVTPPSNQ